MQIISQSGFISPPNSAGWLCFSFYVLPWFLFIFLQRCFRFSLRRFLFFFGVLFWLHAKWSRRFVYARNVFLMKLFNQSHRPGRPNKDDCDAAIHSPSAQLPRLPFCCPSCFSSATPSVRLSVCPFVSSSLVAFILCFFAVCPFRSAPFCISFPSLPFSINRKWAFVLATRRESSTGSRGDRAERDRAKGKRAVLAKFMQSSF